MATKSDAPAAVSAASEPKRDAEAEEPAPEASPASSRVADAQARDSVEQVDEFEEAFFSSLPPEHLDLEAHDDDEDDDRDVRMVRLSEPAVVARRARMRTRVVWGGVACAGIFLLAMARMAFHSEPAPVAKEVPKTAPTVVAVAPSVAPVPVPSAVPAAVVSAEPAPEPSAAPVASAEPAVVASAEPAPSAAPVVSAAPTIEAAPAPSAAAAEPAAAAAPVATGDAKELRKQARKLLESGKAKDAIPAALESTTIEPEHAEGWLLLGAAYQDRGRSAEARQAFVTCVAQAKRGPRGECAAMLR